MGNSRHLKLFFLTSAHVGRNDRILHWSLHEVGIVLNNLRQRLGQSQQPRIDEAAHQGVAACIDHNRKDEEKSRYQNQRRLPDQTMKRFHSMGFGSSSMYPAPRTVTISGGENSRSIFDRRARICASTILVMGS